MGRIVTIFYAAVGIPLTLLCLANLGDYMATGFRFFYSRVVCYSCRDPQEKSRRRRSSKRRKRAQGTRFKALGQRSNSITGAETYLSDLPDNIEKFPLEKVKRADQIEKLAFEDSEKEAKPMKTGGRPVSRSRFFRSVKSNIKFRRKGRQSSDRTEHTAHVHADGDEATFGDKDVRPATSFRFPRFRRRKKDAPESRHRKCDQKNAGEAAPLALDETQDTTKDEEDTEFNRECPDAVSETGEPPFADDCQEASDTEDETTGDDSTRAATIINRTAGDNRDDLVESSSAKVENQAELPTTHRRTPTSLRNVKSEPALKDQRLSSSGRASVRSNRPAKYKLLYETGPDKLPPHYEVPVSLSMRRPPLHKHVSLPANPYNSSGGRRSPRIEEASYKIKVRKATTQRTDDVPILVSVLLLAIYILGGAILFSEWEKDWSVITGAYFTFITLSTIGFGDVIPGSSFFSGSSSQTKYICITLYVVFGLALISMCFNLMQANVVAKVRRLAKKLGIIPEEE